MPKAHPRLQVLLNRIKEWEDSDDGVGALESMEPLLLDIKQCLEDILIYTPHEDLV